MSDQDKPHEWIKCTHPPQNTCSMCAVEWTVETVQELLRWASGTSNMQMVADAHNAAFAAEREALKRLCSQLEDKRIEVQTLADALKGIAHDETIGSYKACDLARAALEKVNKFQAGAQSTLPTTGTQPR